MTDVEAGGGRRRPRATADGPIIRCKALVFATGYEMPDSVPQRRHQVISTYAIATKPQPRNLWPEDCFIWEAADPYLYLRSTPDGRVICGGEDEEFSDEEARDALIPKKAAAIARKLKRLLPRLDTTPEFAWAGAFGSTETGLPSIGAVPGMANCYAVLGFGGNGITYSRIAADIIAGALVRPARSRRRPLRLHGNPRHPVMRMADGDGQRIGRVVAVEGGARQQHADHRPDLLLLGVAGADDRLLDLVRRVFGDGQPGLGRDEKGDAPRLAELQRRRGVAVDEGLLDRRLVGRVVADHRREPAVQRQQPVRQLAVERRMDRAGGDEGERIAARRDDAPAGAAEAGIDAEDANLSDHAERRSADGAAMPARAGSATLILTPGGQHSWPAPTGWRGDG